MRALKAFKNLTIVLNLLCSVIFFAVVAEGNTNAANTINRDIEVLGCIAGSAKAKCGSDKVSFQDHPFSKNPAYKGLQNAVATNGDDETNRCLDKLNKSCRDKAYNSDEAPEIKSCKDAAKDLKEAQTEATKACSKARMGGINACITQANKCNDCQGSSDEDRDSECAVANVGAATNYMDQIEYFIENGSFQEVTSLDSGEQVRYANCPAIASDDLKSFQDEVKDIKKETQDLEKELIELENDLQQLNAEYTQLDTDRDEQIAEAENEINEQMRDYRNQEKEMSREHQNTIVDLQEQVRSTERQITDIDLQIEQQKLERQSQLSELTVNCHSAALERLQQFQEQKRSQIQASLYTAGGFNDLMKGAGISSQAKSTQLRESFFRECTQDRAFTEAKVNIVKASNLAIAVLNKRKNDLRELVRSTEQQIEIAKQRLPEDLQELADEIQQFIDQADKRLQRIHSNYVNQKQSKQAEIQNKQREIELKKAQLASEKNRENQLQVSLSLKETYSKGLRSEAGASSAAISAVLDIQKASTSAALECCKAREGGGDNVCKTACSYLHHTLGIDEDQLGSSYGCQKAKTPGNESGDFTKKSIK